MRSTGTFHSLTSGAHGLQGISAAKLFTIIPNLSTCRSNSPAYPIILMWGHATGILYTTLSCTKLPTRTLCTTIARIHTLCRSILFDWYSTLPAYLHSEMHDQCTRATHRHKSHAFTVPHKCSWAAARDAVCCQLAYNNASSKEIQRLKAKPPHAHAHLDGLKSHRSGCSIWIQDLGNITKGSWIWASSGGCLGLSPASYF